MNVPSPTLYAQQINAAYRHLKELDSSKSPSPIPLNKVLTLDYTVLQENSLEQGTIKKAKFIANTFEHIKNSFLGIF